MVSFSEWYNEIADMPEQDEKGNWYDLEDGIPFAAYENCTDRAAPQRINDKAMDSRKLAKAKANCKALTGTLKQKEWAEKIRWSALELLNQEDAEFVANHTFCTKAKFWIENRKKKASEIVELLRKQRALFAEYQAAAAAEDAAAVARISVDYNAVTAELKL